MHRRPLHRNIPPLQRPPVPGVQQHLNLPLQHDPVVQALRPMHHAGALGREVHDPADGAVGVHEAQRARGQDLVVCGDVGVVVQVCRELRRRVGDAEADGFLAQRDPGGGRFGVDGGFAGGVVGCDVAGEVGEGGGLAGFDGELRLVFSHLEGVVWV